MDMGSKRTEIAIIGMACRFPGADGYDSFWENLIQGQNSISEIPPERWDLERFYSSDINDAGKSTSKWCGMVEGIYDFDYSFFNLSPREVASMDPQQRLLLEETWHCIEDSGISLSELQQKVTSVYTGVMSSDYLQQMEADQADSYACLGNYESLLANRISYAFNLRGMSLPINAACASSLVAIHEARRGLILGECDYALASAVNLNLDPLKYVSFSKSRMLSPTGQCKTFDQSADGYVPGDGVAVLLLQRLEEAVEQGNFVYGIIKGSAVNHTGKSLSITAPRVEAQRDVIMSAWRAADVDPRTITYIEAHGTGTSLGDPIEVEALTQAFRHYTSDRSFCKIGSVKTNIGHLESAAGMAGLIKVILMMKHQKIPASLHVQTLNPIIPFRYSPFEVVTEKEIWQSQEQGQPLRAGISSFGFGGVNAHVVIERYEPASKPAIQPTLNVEPESSEPFRLFLLSAKTAASLRQLVADWQHWLDRDANADCTLNDISMSLLMGREHFKHRFGGWVRTRDEIRDLLNSDHYSNPQTGANQWYLNINSPKPEEYSQMKDSEHIGGILLRNVEMQVEAELGTSGTTKDIMSGYYQENWIEERRELYHFIAEYVHAEALIQLGFNPVWVQGTGVGTLVAWVIGGIVSVEDMISVLIGEQSTQEVRLFRPRFPVKQGEGECVIMPFAFDDAYVYDLIQSVRMIRHTQYEEFRSELMNQAHRLYSHQYTFRNYINEWNDEWREHAGADIGMQFEPIATSGSVFQTASSSSAVLCIVIMDAMRKLNQKWNLQGFEKLDIPAVYELLDLLADRVITQRDIVGMFLSEENLSRITDQLNKQAYRMLPERAYTLIREHQQRTDGMESVRQFLQDFLQSKDEDDAGPLQQHSGSCSDWMKQAGQEADEMSLNMPFAENALKLWLAGTELDMGKLVEREPYQKVHLPLYAFQRKTFRWSSDSGKSASSNHSKQPELSKRNRSLHPMLHHDFSTDQDIRFISDFTGSEFFLADHQVRGQRILPGVAYLEMARMAIHTAKQFKSDSFHSLQMSNVAWTQPIYVDANPVKVTVTLNAVGREEEGIRYEIYREDHPSLNRINCGTGSVSLKSFEPNDPLDIASLLKAMSENQILDRGTIYSMLRELGLEYGPSHQAIERVYIGSGEAIAHLKLPMPVEHTLHDYMMHPSMMDGALQTAMLLLNVESTRQDQENRTKLPFYMEKMECRLPCAAEMWVHVRLRNGGRNGTHVEQLDMDLVDAQGAVCVRIRNYMCRILAGENLLEQEKLRSEGRSVHHTRNWHEAISPGLELLAPVWSVHSPEKDSRISSTNLRTVLMLREETERIESIDELKQQYPGASLIFIKPDESMDQLSQRLEACGKLDHLIWISPAGRVEGKDAEAIIQSQHEGVMMLFHLVKHLLRLGYERHSLLWTLVTFNAIAVHAQDEVHPLHASMHGFLGSLAKEYRGWTFRLVDLDLADSSLPPFHEMPVRNADVSGHLMVYRGRQWHRRELLPVELPSIQHSAYRRHGVYVVIGGAGGLGKVWSEYMIRRYSAQIVWVGRTPLNAGIAYEQERLAALGGPMPEYISADAGSPEEMREVCKVIRQHHGTIHGVIHAAIALRDSSVMNMNYQQFTEGLYAKVNVCAGMLAAFGKESLDFMLFFSSINAFATPAGQSNYAAGCTFKDSFAQWLQRNLPYPVKTMNWGYWGSVGTVASQGYRDRMTKQGIGSIEPPEAMAALELLLAGPLHQLGLVKIVGEAKPYAISEQEIMTVHH